MYKYKLFEDSFQIRQLNRKVNEIIEDALTS